MLNILLFFVITTVVVQGIFTISWIIQYGLNFGDQKDLCSYSENFWLHQVFIFILFVLITIYYLLSVKVFIASYFTATLINVCIIWVLNKKIKRDYDNNSYEELKSSYWGAFIPLFGSIFYLLELKKNAL